MNPHRTGQGRSRRGALLAALMLPVALLLSGCQLNAGISVTSGGMLVVDIEFRDETGTLKNANIDCSSFGIKSSDFPGALSADIPEDVTPGEVACRIHGVAENAVGSGMLSDSGSTYTLTLGKSMIQGLGRLPAGATSRLKTKIVVKMPGEIVSATPGGEVEGSKVTYADAAILQSGEIVIEGKKSDGVSPMLWVGAGLVAVLVALVAVMWVFRRRRTGVGDGDPDDAEIVKPEQFADTAKGEDLKVREHVEQLAPASTTESAVDFDTLPDSFELDSDAAELGEEIGMVTPLEHGAGADAVPREASKILPAIPAANTETSPIPGMPPRMPMPDELMADYGVAEPDAPMPETPAAPGAPAAADVPTMPGLPPIPGVGDVPALPDIDGPIDEGTASQMPPRIPFDEDLDIAAALREE